MESTIKNELILALMIGIIVIMIKSSGTTPIESWIDIIIAGAVIRFIAEIYRVVILQMGGE